MCGIGGLVLAEPDEGLDLTAQAMVDALAHRGPDGHGCHLEPRLALVHTRLAILDTSDRGAQPMRSRSGRMVICYNGEVFNHQELRHRLPTHEWRTTCDTETVLELFAAFGAECLPWFNGLFAFAVLDTETGVLHLARDRWGVKPLYFSTHPGRFGFASELNALLAGGVPRKPSALFTREAMTGWIQGPYTPIEGVHRLMPGQHLRLNTGDLSYVVDTWFTPTELVSRHRPAPRSDAEVVARLEELLRQSVARRLQSDVPVAVMCSGGVDSSLIATFAHDVQPVQAYCATVTDQPTADESRYASMVCEHRGIPLRLVELNADSWCANLVSTVEHVGYPLTHANSVAMYLIAQAAYEDGVKVLLSGEGADELFGGYTALHPRAYRQYEERGGALLELARTLRQLARDRGWARDPQPDPLPAFSTQARDFQRSVIAQARSAYSSSPAAERRLEAALLSDLQLYLPHLLNRQDKATMQASVETRVPFLDPDLVEYALNLPLHQRVQPERKAPLKAIARTLLPLEAIDRPKRGFGFRFDSYLREKADPDFLFKDSRLQQILKRTDDQWRTHCEQAAGLSLLLVWSGEIWARLFVEGSSVASIESQLWSRLGESNPGQPHYE